MKSKIKWADGVIISIKINDELFTIAQVRGNHFLQFFNIKNKTGEWTGIDLNQEDPIFCIMVAEKKIKSIFFEEINPELVSPNLRPMPKNLISRHLWASGPNRADLIEFTDDYTNNPKIIISGLTIDRDLEVIHRYEYIGMVGDQDKIINRLLTFFDTGVNWDTSKAFIFPGIKPPPQDFVVG